MLSYCNQLTEALRSADSYLVLGEKSIADASHQHHGDQQRNQRLDRHGDYRLGLSEVPQRTNIGAVGRSLIICIQDVIGLSCAQ